MAAIREGFFMAASFEKLTAPCSAIRILFSRLDRSGSTLIDSGTRQT